MTASETYKLLRRVVGPWYKRNGFKLAKGYLTYQKALGAKFFNVRWQCNSHGWEKFKGSSFAIHIDFSDGSNLDSAPLRRLTEYLGFEQLELIRARQNRVLASIPPPPADYVQSMVAGFEKTFRDPKPYIDLYLKGWASVSRPYRRNDDIWFRYFTEADVRAWAIMLQQHVEGIYERNVQRSAA